MDDKMVKLNGKSFDVVDDNISKLKEIFPEVVNGDNQIDFDNLRDILEKDIEVVDTGEEHYKFTWWGKQESKRKALESTTKTLRPSIKDSKNWNETENIYIEGDNLDALKILLGSYRNRIKMIYIDPPYNTGKDFIYHDNRTETKLEHLENTNQLNEEGQLLENPRTEGKFHSNWLNMIYPRLYVARKLLTDDGVIFISIDDNELKNLKEICDEIFGEENFVSNIIWEKNFAPKNDNKYISISHEYALCYAKYKNKFKRNLLPRTEEHNKGYKNPDNDDRGVWSSGTMLATSFSEKYVYGIEKPNGEIAYPPDGRCWRFSKEKVDELINDNRIWFGKDGGNVPRIKRFLTEVTDGIVPQSLWKHTDVGNNQNATNDLKKIFSGKHLFTFPKPVNYIKRMIHIGSNDNDIILDFFAGSGTTSQAIMDINNEENTNRKFIMVQLDEPVDSKSEAYKSGFENISEICKERIRRAGDSIINESDKDLDIGFKVFKIDESNFIPWNPKIKTPKEAEQAILGTANNLVRERTELDLVYELLLQLNLDLNAKIEEKQINNHKFYVVNNGFLLICLEPNIDESIAKDIINLKEELMTEYCKVILLDKSLNAISSINIFNDLDSENIELDTI